MFEGAIADNTIHHDQGHGETNVVGGFSHDENLDSVSSDHDDNEPAHPGEHDLHKEKGIEMKYRSVPILTGMVIALIFCAGFSKSAQAAGVNVNRFESESFTITQEQQTFIDVNTFDANSFDANQFNSFDANQFNNNFVDVNTFEANDSNNFAEVNRF